MNKEFLGLEFRGPQLCKIIGITYRQLDYWGRTGLLIPSVKVARNSGSQRIYSYLDLLKAEIIKELIDFGMALQTVRKAIDRIMSDKEWLENPDQSLLVIGTPGPILVWSFDELRSIMEKGHGVISIISGTSCIRELESKISQSFEMYKKFEEVETNA